jgi:hypothetical protein
LSNRDENSAVFVPDFPESVGNVIMTTAPTRIPITEAMIKPVTNQPTLRVG